MATCVDIGFIQLVFIVEIDGRRQENNTEKIVSERKIELPKALEVFEDGFQC